MWFKMVQAGGISDMYWHFSGTFSMCFHKYKSFTARLSIVGKPVGLQPRLYKGILYVVLGGRWSCSLSIPAIWFHCVVSQEVSWISEWAFAQHWLKTVCAFWLPWESHLWFPYVPALEKGMFLAPGALRHVMVSLYRSTVADLPSFLTRDSWNT